MITARVAASVSVILLTVANAGLGREWKDASGERSRSGEFVAYQDGRVVVRLPDGKEASASLKRFCAADQAYVQDLVKGNAGRGAIPAKLAAQTVQARTSGNDGGSAPVTSLAQTAPPEELTPPAGSSSAPEERTGGTSHDKRVFYTHCGTFHIIRGETGIAPIIGTAHYAFPFWWPPSCCGCCCSPCHGPWYLSFLRETRFAGGWLYARDIGTSEVTRWAFAYFNDDGCGHPIWYKKAGSTTWRFYGYASWVHPK